MYIYREYRHTHTHTHRLGMAQTVRPRLVVCDQNYTYMKKKKKPERKEYQTEVAKTP